MAEALDGMTGYLRSDCVIKFFYVAEFIDLLQVVFDRMSLRQRMVNLFHIGPIELTYLASINDGLRIISIG